MIDRRRIKYRAARKRTPEHIRIHVREIMGNRVPRVDADRFVPILLAYTEKPACDLSVRLVPGYLLPSAARASNGASQPVGIFILFLQSVSLWTDIASGKGMVFIASHD